jgi:hypothetical protein
VAFVRERTIPTERASIVGEVSVNVCGNRLPHGQCDGSLRSYSRLNIMYYSKVDKSKAILETGLGGLCVCETSRILHF